MVSTEATSNGETLLIRIINLELLHIFSRQAFLSVIFVFFNIFIEQSMYGSDVSTKCAIHFRKFITVYQDLQVSRPQEAQFEPVHIKFYLINEG